jgi:FAD/FMN-containing dehydrogenase
MVASGTSGPLASKYGTISNWVHQLEVVLPNGDILQTERLNKRELNKRKGVQGFEGDVYRALDNLINDNQQLINEKIASDIPDNVGYSAIARVKGKDGSFDLMPLFLGSQGTLGIISEMIMKAEFTSAHSGVAVATFASREAARDALDHLRQFEPALLEYFDSSLFDIAAEHGKTYSSYKEAGFIAEAVILIGFDDFNDRVNVKKLKKIQKSLMNDDVFFVAATGGDAKELLTVREVTAYLVNPSAKGSAAPPLFNDVYIPAERFEDFLSVTKTLAEKFHVALPIHYRALDGLVSTRPTLQLHKVGDKQKIFKLLDEYAKLVADYGGHLIGNGGEGRVKANFAYKQLDDDVLELFSAIKAIFDPYGLFNPGVKQATELRHLVTQLRSDYDTAAFASFVPYN